MSWDQWDAVEGSQGHFEVDQERQLTFTTNQAIAPHHTLLRNHLLTDLLTNGWDQFIVEMQTTSLLLRNLQVVFLPSIATVETKVA